MRRVSLFGALFVPMEVGRAGLGKERGRERGQIPRDSRSSATVQRPLSVDRVGRAESTVKLKIEL